MTSRNSFSASLGLPRALQQAAEGVLDQQCIRVFGAERAPPNLQRLPAQFFRLISPAPVREYIHEVLLS